MVCDAEWLILLEDATTNAVRDAARLLEIERYIYWVPPLPTNYGTLDGASYDTTVSSSRNKLHPEDFEQAAAQLPEKYRHKITGLFRLLHVNALYRQARTVKERVLATLMQNAYNYLLRNPEAEQEEAVIDYATNRLSGGFAHSFRQDAVTYREEFGEYLGHFHGMGFLRRYGGTLSIPDARHPLSYL